MGTIRTTSIFWIILLNCIVRTCLCMVLPVLAEQSNVAVDETARIDERLSMNWHPMIRQIAYNEAFLGNSQLEETDVSLILSMAEKSDIESSYNRRFLEESIWKLLVSMPLNLDAGKGVFRKLIARARLHGVPWKGADFQRV